MVKTNWRAVITACWALCRRRDVVDKLERVVRKPDPASGSAIRKENVPKQIKTEKN